MRTTGTGTFRRRRAVISQPFVQLIVSRIVWIMTRAAMPVAAHRDTARGIPEIRRAVVRINRLRAQ